MAYELYGYLVDREQHSMAELARRLGVRHAGTLTREIEEGRLRALRVDQTHWQILTADVLRWLGAEPAGPAEPFTYAYTGKELAEQLGIRPEVVHRAYREGRLRARNLNRAGLRILASEARAWRTHSPRTGAAELPVREEGPHYLDRDVYSIRDLQPRLRINDQHALIEPIGRDELRSASLSGSAGHRIEHSVLLTWLRGQPLGPDPRLRPHEDAAE